MQNGQPTLFANLLTQWSRIGIEPRDLVNAVKSIVRCVLCGAAFGAFLGGVTGGVVGAFYFLVGALIGGPIGIIIGGAVGAVCGLCGGILGGRRGWPLGGGLGVALFVAAALHSDLFSYPVDFVLAIVFLGGAFIGQVAYQRVWQQTPGIYPHFFAHWREYLQTHDYDRTTLHSRLIAGWAIVGTAASIIALLQAIKG